MLKRLYIAGTLAAILVACLGVFLISRPNSPCLGQNNAQPSVSPNGKKIAYLHYENTGNNYFNIVCVMDISGANKRQTMTSQKAVVTTSMMWSPDSNKLSVTHIMPENAFTYIVSDDGSTQTMIGTGIVSAFLSNSTLLWSNMHITDLQGQPVSGVDLPPGEGASLSPDRRFIAFRPSSEPESLWIVSVDGSDLRKLTDGFNAAWWTSMSELYYKEYKSSPDDYDVYIITLDATRKFITKGNQWTTLHQSPDALQIVFTRMLADHSRIQIYLADADGQNERLFSDGFGTDFGPQWTHDGKKIIFTSHRDGETNIYAADINGSELKQLTGLGS